MRIKEKMPEPIISFKNFTFKYGSNTEPTLKNINLDIYPKEKVLILGPSGCGKSTLGNCINGLIPNQFKGEMKGECRIKGKNLRDSSIFALSKHVGTILQDADAQFVGLSVKEDIAFVLENRNTPVPEMRKLTEEAAKRLNVIHLLESLPYDLSGGQKQKVSIAGILQDDVDIILLDEPLAALDPDSGVSMMKLINTLNEEDKAIVIIEHRFEDVLTIDIDKVVLMDKGEIVAIMTVDEIIKSGLLVKYGIKEPLYISVLRDLKYDFSEKSGLGKIDNLDFSDVDVSEIINSEEPPEKELGETIINIENMKFSYSDSDFISIDNLKIRQGEMIALLGENGSGKSTISNLLTGILKPKSGKIDIVGNPESIKEIAEKIGYVMQNPNQMLVCGTLTEEMTLALTLRNYPKEKKEEICADILKKIGLYGYRNWPSNSLSYGQRKRLSVGVMLALNPNCLILDEPTAGQDFGHYLEIMKFVKELNEKHGITIIFITHDMHLALEYTQRSIVLENGKVIADDETFKILSDDDLIKRTALKKTSLFTLAEKLNVAPKALLSFYLKEAGNE